MHLDPRLKVFLSVTVNRQNLFVPVSPLTDLYVSDKKLPLNPRPRSPSDSVPFGSLGHTEKKGQIQSRVGQGVLGSSFLMLWMVGKVLRCSLMLLRKKLLVQVVAGGRSLMWYVDPEFRWPLMQLKMSRRAGMSLDLILCSVMGRRGLRTHTPRPVSARPLSRTRTYGVL